VASHASAQLSNPRRVRRWLRLPDAQKLGVTFHGSISACRQDDLVRTRHSADPMWRAISRGA
jgi:hypothetical protein